MEKHVKIDDEAHQIISLVKFYGNISMGDFGSALVKEALASPIFEKVLMDFLLDKKKVEFVMKKIREN